MKKVKTRQNSVGIALTAGIVIMMILIIVSLWGFTKAVNETTRESNLSKLKELSRQGGLAVQARLDGLLDELRYRAGLVSEGASEELALNCEWSEFSEIISIDHEGNSGAANYSDREFFKRAFGGSDYVGYNSRTVFLAVPVNNAEGSPKGVLMAKLPSSVFADTLSADAFSGQASVNLVDSVGEFIVNNGGNNDSSNVLALLNEAQYLYGYEREKTLQDISTGKEGYSFYTLNMQSYCIYYYPLENTDWMLIGRMSGMQSNSMQTSVNYDAYRMVGAITLITVVFVLVISFFATNTQNYILRINRQLQLSRKAIKVAAEQSANIIFEYDKEGRKLICFGETEAENVIFDLNDDKFAERLFGVENLPESSLNNITELFGEIDGGAETVSRLIKIKRDGVRWYQITMTATSDPKITAVGTIADISEQRNQERQLLKRAEKDQLTNIYNRQTAQETIEDFISSYVIDDKRIGAFMYLDLDKFKEVNDNLGHGEGDEVLIKVSSKLRSLFRKSDIIGRFGGDEFGIFLTDLPNEQIALLKAEELNKAVRIKAKGGKPEETIEVTCSIGIALFPEHGKTFEELYKKADIALYKAKEQKGKYVIYNDSFAKDGDKPDGEDRE